MGGRRLRAARFRRPRVAGGRASRGRRRRSRLSQLREFGLDPASDRARRAVELVGANSRWEHDGQPYWEGEVEECINGRTVADGAYFGVDVSPIVDAAGRRAPGRRRLELRAGQRLGPLVVRTARSTCWKGCWSSSERPAARRASREARASGEEFLLERSLFRRLSTGEPADERSCASCIRTAGTTTSCGRWTTSAPPRLTGAGRPAARRGHRPRPVPAPRRTARGRSTGRLPGRVWFDVDDGPGRPSRWVTLRAMRSRPADGARA